ncbi:E3 ubiquitin-protein ligase CHIP-like [Bidens hawaiensis]|uniref:E3 ubiquitin-protein ligase CHIP-like n=1 Tax=Bidens hawaiensis TaxID=980011 RepID=UPI0040491A7E
MTKGVFNSAAEQAEQLKQDGNLYFKKNRLNAAIDAYTEAITLCPNVAVYYTNRALCHLKRNEWTRVEEDSQRAVRLDHKSVKGHYMLGLALLEREVYAEGIKALERALDLGRGAHPNSYMVEEIWQALASAKYKEWVHDSTERNLALQKLEKSCELALEEQFLYYLNQQMDGTDDATYSSLEQIAVLKKVFSKAAEDDKPTDVPDYLCCKITLDIFRDPVITPSGLTYERAVILDHLEKVGKFDPTTREPLHPSQLVSNLAIKEAVGAYLEKHGWAYKMN